MQTTTTFALALLAMLTPVATHAATPKADNGLVGYNALNLTPAQQRSVYQSVGAASEATPPEHYLIHVGGEVPASMTLKPLPAAATAKVSQLKSDDYVKLDEGQLLLVKPQDRTIVEIIDHHHGTADGQTG